MFSKRKSEDLIKKYSFTVYLQNVSAWACQHTPTHLQLSSTCTYLVPLQAHCNSQTVNHAPKPHAQQHGLQLIIAHDHDKIKVMGTYRTCARCVLLYNRGGWTATFSMFSTFQQQWTLPLTLSTFSVSVSVSVSLSRSLSLPDERLGGSEHLAIHVASSVFGCLWVDVQPYINIT